MKRKKKKRKAKYKERERERERDLYLDNNFQVKIQKRTQILIM